MLNIIIMLVAFFIVCFLALKIAQKCAATEATNTDIYHEALRSHAKRLKEAGIIQSEYDFMCGANTLKNMMADNQD